MDLLRRVVDGARAWGATCTSSSRRRRWRVGISWHSTPFRVRQADAACHAGAVGYFRRADVVCRCRPRFSHRPENPSRRRGTSSLDAEQPSGDAATKTIARSEALSLCWLKARGHRADRLGSAWAAASRCRGEAISLETAACARALPTVPRGCRSRDNIVKLTTCARAPMLGCRSRRQDRARAARNRSFAGQRRLRSCSDDDTGGGAARRRLDSRGPDWPQASPRQRSTRRRLLATVARRQVGA